MGRTLEKGLAYQELQSAAQEAVAIDERVFGHGDGLPRRIADGAWGEHVSSRDALDLAAVWRATAEKMRYARALTGEIGLGGHEDLGRSSIHRQLPLNRKERYYTGTVLPMLMASDGFANLDRFLKLCGLEVAVDPGLGGLQDFQFFTEYGFAESVFTPQDRERWPELVEADTPDVVIGGPDWLVAVEAKMFHSPTAADLDTQMRRQAAVIEMWIARLGLHRDRVAHVLLLPEALARSANGHGWPIVLWEDVLDAYRTVGPRYWANVLSEALLRYDELVTRPLGFGRNAVAKMSGADIVDAHATGELDFDHVGRGGGLRGARFQEDVVSGRWRTFVYEVRQGSLPGNKNWFTVGEFIVATAKSS